MKTFICYLGDGEDLKEVELNRAGWMLVNLSHERFHPAIDLEPAVREKLFPSPRFGVMVFISLN